MADSDQSSDSDVIVVGEVVQEVAGVGRQFDTGVVEDAPRGESDFGELQGPSWAYDYGNEDPDFNVRAAMFGLDTVREETARLEVERRQEGDLESTDSQEAEAEFVEVTYSHRLSKKPTRIVPKTQKRKRPFEKDTDTSDTSFDSPPPKPKRGRDADEDDPDWDPKTGRYVVGPPPPRE